MSCYEYWESPEVPQWHFALYDEDRKIVLRDNNTLKSARDCLLSIQLIKFHCLNKKVYSKIRGDDKLYYLRVSDLDGHVVALSEGCRTKTELTAVQQQVGLIGKGAETIKV